MAADVDGAARRDVGFWWREIRSLGRAAVREHVDALRQDVKYAFRTMRRTPGFTLMAVLMLALGTGVNVAMFELGDTMRDILTNYTTPGFFSLMKVPIVAGRAFSADDTRASTPVTIVNQMLATRIRPDGGVIGQRILVKFQSGPAAAAPVERRRHCQHA